MNCFSGLTPTSEDAAEAAASVLSCRFAGYGFDKGPNIFTDAGASPAFSDVGVSPEKFSPE
jgi:hypothetical protein